MYCKFGADRKIGGLGARRKQTFTRFFSHFSNAPFSKMAFHENEFFSGTCSVGMRIKPVYAFFSISIMVPGTDHENEKKQ